MGKSMRREHTIEERLDGWGLRELHGCGEGVGSPPVEAVEAVAADGRHLQRVRVGAGVGAAVAVGCVLGFLLLTGGGEAAGPEEDAPAVVEPSSVEEVVEPAVGDDLGSLNRVNLRGVGVDGGEVRLSRRGGLGGGPGGGPGGGEVLRVWDRP